MHLELPRMPIVRFKDFVKHYLMIVVSILTALGLEAWIEHHHHTRAAESSSQQIEMELRTNLVSIGESLKVDQHNLKPLRDIDDAITKDIRAGLSKAAINQHIQLLRKQFMLNLDWPSMNNQAWDVAVANQSATWMRTSDLRRYSMAYIAQHSADDWLMHASTIALNAPRMAELQTQLDLGVAVDPIEFVSILRQMIDTLRETQSHLMQTRLDLSKALSARTDTAIK